MEGKNKVTVVSLPSAGRAADGITHFSIFGKMGRDISGRWAERPAERVGGHFAPRGAERIDT